MELMKIFKVSEFISLRLERGTTNIYVKGELFRQCKFLLLTIPTNDDLDDINSIDEASDYLDYSLDPDTEYVEPEKQEIIDGISPETEFWAHCSNLQTWAEYNYDTRLLHRNLAFPLLKKLTEEGDLIAKKKFKEEIGRRYFSGGESVQTYLEEEGYMKYLSKDEFRSFIHSGADVINEIEDILGVDLKITTLFENFANVFIKNGEIIGLELSHLNLKKIPDCIQRLSHLEILNLVDNELREIPEWIGELSTLKKLIAVNNKIKKIPESIEKLESLEFLDLAVNELEQLPESIGSLISLKELLIYTNRIKRLPESIGNFKSLKKIFASKNLLQGIPESIGNLTELQTLNLGNNPIKSLPTSISKITSLKELSIRKTQIKEDNTTLNKLKEKKVEIYI